MTDYESADDFFVSNDLPQQTEAIEAEATLPLKRSIEMALAHDNIFGSHVAINVIMPSPENDEIYPPSNTQDQGFSQLVYSIREQGVLEPLVVSLDGYIISGHRRYAAAKQLGLETVPIRFEPIYRKGQDKLEWKRVLRGYNRQRVKTEAVQLREACLDMDPKAAYELLLDRREHQNIFAPPEIQLEGARDRACISSGKQEFLSAIMRVIQNLRDYHPLSVRQVHYQLLNSPPLRNTSTKNQQRYANDSKSYKDLCDLVARARLQGSIPWNAITDPTRPTTGRRHHHRVSEYISQETYLFLNRYRRDLLQSQPDHIELVVEKLTVQSIIQPIATKYCLPMTVGRGYCSLEPRYDMVQRFRHSGKDRLVILIVSDLDPDGDEIAQSFARSIRDDFSVTEVRASKILLRPDQVKRWDLPPSQMKAKRTSSSFEKYVQQRGTDEVFELEAVAPPEMQDAVESGIIGCLDLEAFDREVEREKKDAVKLGAVKKVAVEAIQALCATDVFDELANSEEDQ